MRTLFALLIAIVVAGGCASPSPEPPPRTQNQGVPFNRQGELTFEKEGEDVVTIAIEIADTDSLRGRGLMERTSLPDRSGMLFEFPFPDIQRFYMANTQMSLDFFFVGEDSVVVNTVKYAQPLSLDNIASTGPAKWVVEVEAGFIDTWGLVAGDRIRYRRDATE